MNMFELSKRFNALKESGYCEMYEKLFASQRHDVKNILELGINNGGSLLMWREYFPNAKVFGVDIKPSPLDQSEDRIFTLQASQADIPAIFSFLDSYGCSFLDFIIDDAAHIGSLAKASFWPLFDERLKPSGHYIIEDWGTGYWSDWPDGRSFVEPDTTGEEDGHFPSHDRGMVGFVKQLVDESHRFAIKDAENRRPSKFSSLTFIEAMAIAQKTA